MNYEDERYVRLFVRDTPTWDAFTPESRAVLPNLMRKLDKDGRIEWPVRLGLAALAKSLKLRLKWVEIALPDLASHGTIELGEGWLKMPNFVPAQNVMSLAKSPAERTREWKARIGYQHPSKRRGDVVETAETPSPAQPSDSQAQPTEQTRGRATAAQVRPKGRKPKQPVQLDHRVEAVLAAIDRERAKFQLGPLPPSERLERPILTRLEDGIPIDDLVLAVELHSADGGSGRLNATTPFTAPSGRGPGGWSWSRRLLDEHRAKAPARPPVIDDHDVPEWAREPHT